MMASKSAVISSAIEGKGPHSDGRRERSRASRIKILHAMMDLISEGHVDPSAAKVAERAGVGLRSVFRHFDDKESIYREMDEILTNAYAPQMLEPYKSADWREQLAELVERRAKVYEEIAPFRISTSVQRVQSPALMDNYRRLLRAERKALYALLPDEVRADEHRTRAILLATSFDTWRLLRHDEELSRRKTVEATKRLLKDILDQVGEG